MLGPEERIAGQKVREYPGATHPVQCLGNMAVLLLDPTLILFELFGRAAKDGQVHVAHQLSHGVIGESGVVGEPHQLRHVHRRRLRNTALGQRGQGQLGAARLVVRRPGR